MQPFQSSPFVNEPMWYQVSAGLSGKSVVLRSGVNLDLNTGTGWETLWQRGGLYAYPPSATVMTVSSGSANDTSAGTGARTVVVSGLNASYVEQSETVALNGQTGVSTVNSYLRITSVLVASTGSGGENAGNVYIGTGVITAGVPDVVYGEATAGWNGSQHSFYTVPAGFSAYLVDVSGSASSTTNNKQTLFSIRARTQGGVFYRGGSLVIGSGAFYLSAAIPRKFTEKSDIDAIAMTTDTGISATCQLRYLLVAN